MLFRTAKWSCLILIVVVLAPAAASATVLSQSGISYTYGVAPAIDYPDDTMTKLTDGATDQAAGFAHCAGWHSKDADISNPNITFKLGQAYLLDEIKVNYAVCGAAAIAGLGWLDGHPEQ